jgi:arylsulfatase A-like enzyme
VGWRIADAYLAIAALLVVELFVVGAVAHRELAGGYELTRALRNLLPIAVAAAAPVAIAGGVLVEIVRRAERPATRIALGVIAALYGGGVAYGVSAGRLFAGGRRPGFVAIVALAALVAGFLIGPVLARTLARAQATLSRRAGLFGAVGVILIGVEIANAIVLPRLYPAFHLGLAGVALLIAPFVSLALPTPSAPRASDAGRPFRVSSGLLRAISALLLFTAAAALAPSAARRLSRQDNIRLIYLAHAPLLGHAVEIGTLLSPPEPLDSDSALPEARAGGASIDLRGRDIVLITIDALRADHTGAYGYSRRTTPNLDRLADQGLVFEAAYTPTPHTSYAITSLMTGKYMRPLVLQGLGADSETWAAHLRRYGYRTAAFYPPAVFFIDEERLAAMRDRRLDFEYSKVQFSTAAARADEVRAYLSALPGATAGEGSSQGLFLWVHLFEPHEPYEAHAEHPFGERDIDRYDAEIAAADAGAGAIIDAVRAARSNAMVIVTADHGEEFLEHGGRYHGTTVYEEQVRVPLIVSAPGLIKPGRVATPVQLVDLLPTVLSGLDIPRPARVRGTNLGAYLTGAGRVGAPGGADPAGPADRERRQDLERGLAFSETDAHTMLARGSLRLLCARKIGACALYDVARDPGQTADISASRPADLAEMRTELRALEASHGRFEVRGLRTEGKGWPDALRRGMAGDGDAAPDVAALLDDADVVIRRKAAEILFELKRPETAASLRLALLRDEDDEVRRWSALALTRLGEGAPRTRELLEDRDVTWRRLAALALAESGDDRGEAILIAWWREAFDPKDRRPDRAALPFERAREIAAALAHIRSKDAVPALIEGLKDVRLRPHLAEALAAIGSDAARPALAKQLEGERYQTARIAIAEALVKLGAGPELRDPLVWLLGTPDPLPGGVGIALAADLLEHVGGPRASALTKLRRFARSGVAVGMVVPKPVTPRGAPPSASPSPPGIRVLCRARSLDGRRGEVRVGLRARPGWAPESTSQDSLVPADAPELDPARSTVLEIAPGKEPVEPFATFPKTVGVKPGDHREFVVYATQNVEVLACVVVPLSEELPPPPPEPWSPPPDEAQPH